MLNTNPTFKARAYGSQKNITHIMLMWAIGKEFFTQIVKFKASGETIEVELPDGEEYIMTFYPDREDQLKIYADNLFSVETCEVKLQEERNLVSA